MTKLTVHNQTKESSREEGHGQHNIEQELTHPKRPYLILHDWCGFQTGSTDKSDGSDNSQDNDEVRRVQKFLEKRLHSVDRNE